MSAANLGRDLLAIATAEDRMCISDWRRVWEIQIWGRDEASVDLSDSILRITENAAGC